MSFGGVVGLFGEPNDVDRNPFNKDQMRLLCKEEEKGEKNSNERMET
jgi:hypothetical protein